MPLLGELLLPSQVCALLGGGTALLFLPGAEQDAPITALGHWASLLAPCSTAGLGWGTQDQNPSLCTQIRAARVGRGCRGGQELWAGVRGGQEPWPESGVSRSLSQGSGVGRSLGQGQGCPPWAGEGGWQQGQHPSVSLSFPAALSSLKEVTLSLRARVWLLVAGRGSSAVPQGTGCV